MAPKVAGSRPVGHPFISFETYVKRLLAPALRPGQVVVITARGRTRKGGPRHVSKIRQNPSLGGGIALWVRFRPEELPYFVQWTMTGEGTYVVGLEPATCRVGGYQREEEGRVIHLATGESRRFRLQIGSSPMPG